MSNCTSFIEQLMILSGLVSMFLLYVAQYLDRFNGLTD